MKSSSILLNLFVNYLIALAVGVGVWLVLIKVGLPPAPNLLISFLVFAIVFAAQPYRTYKD